eukprot:scaffold2913_cov181-Ochromonas_danica.AAC.48
MSSSLCNVSQEKLESQYDLKVADDCPVCGIKVGYHLSDLTAQGITKKAVFETITGFCKDLIAGDKNKRKSLDCEPHLAEG